MDTKIVTQLAVDSPVNLGASYEFDKSDRKYIDDQIRGLEQHVVDDLINGVIATWYQIDNSSSQLAVGDNVTFAGTQTTPTVTKAIPSSMYGYSVPAGIVVQVSPANGKARIAMEGAIPPSITGLATGSPGFVRIASNGRCERIASPSTSDYVIGSVDQEGNLAFARTIGTYPGNPSIPHGTGVVFVHGGSFDANGSMGTANQVLTTNGTATDVGWSSSLSLSALTLAATLTLSALSGSGAGLASIDNSGHVGFESFSSLAGAITLAGDVTHAANANLVEKLTGSGGLVQVPNGTSIEFLDGSSHTAASGNLRMPNATTIIAARDQANTGDIRVLATDSSNVVTLGDNAGNVAGVNILSNSLIQIANTGYTISLDNTGAVTFAAVDTMLGYTGSTSGYYFSGAVSAANVGFNSAHATGAGTGLAIKAQDAHSGSGLSGGPLKLYSGITDSTSPSVGMGVIEMWGGSNLIGTWRITSASGANTNDARFSLGTTAAYFLFSAPNSGQALFFQALAGTVGFETGQVNFYDASVALAAQLNLNASGTTSLSVYTTVSTFAIGYSGAASGAGGATNISGQDAGGTGNNGGDVNVAGGAHTTTGHDGKVNLKSASTTVFTAGPDSSGVDASQVLGAMTWAGRSVSGSYTVDSSGPDLVLEVDVSGGTSAITLPTPYAGRLVIVKDAKQNAATDNITVTRGNVAHYIDGIQADLVIQANNACVWLYGVDSTHWITIAAR